jgi:hypothetical protein
MPAIAPAPAAGVNWLLHYWRKYDLLDPHLMHKPLNPRGTPGGVSYLLSFFN